MVQRLDPLSTSYLARNLKTIRNLQFLPDHLTQSLTAVIEDDIVSRKELIEDDTPKLRRSLASFTHEFRITK